ncbi:MAG: hypothetical protein A2V83_07565 [Nitrospirae bacterium RBG_16_64_22]|nr:MAG: hypothetical protein A2V83_07565 [Nitrospirae bacterium RBG_16_64_22]
MLRAIRRVCVPRQSGAGGILVALILLLADPAGESSATAASQNGGKGPGGGERLFSMEFRDVEVRDVLRALGQEAGLNIIVGEEVTGKATLSFRQVTVDNALEAILRSRGLTSLRQGNIIWVVPAGDKVEEGMEIRTFAFNYATPKELTSALKPATSKAGSLIVDERTNTLIAKDFPRNLDRVTTLLAKLDTVTPQIMIEARIVETTKSFAHQLGIQWGGAYSRDAAHGTALPYRFPNTAITSGTGKAAGPSGIVGSSATGTTSASGQIGDNFAVNLPISIDPYGAIGLTLGSIGNFFQLGVKLSAMEDAGMGRILSNPRIMTLNNGEAKISSGVKIPIQTVTTGTPTPGSPQTTGIQTIDAFLRLTVTPQVTSDQRVLMKLETEKDEPDWNRQVQGIPTIISRKANSTLMVMDGETIVIGGILQRSESDLEHGIPGLSKIPLLGRLFRSDVKSDSQTELLIFITPKIVQGRV